MAHWSADYIGLPWSVDYHCWSLLQDIYRQQYAIDLPDMQYDAASLLAAIRAFGHKQSEYTRWITVEQPSEGDVVVMAVGGRPRHIGVWVVIMEGGSVLHNVEGAGVVLSDVSELPYLGFMVHGFYRRAGNG